jgi:type II secretory pathway pseudopilin PulG
MTIIELIISLVILGLVVTAALGFLSTQTRAFQKGMDRMAALQTVRFAAQALETDVVTAGTNVSGGQPSLVYAGTDVLAFNADYATNVPADPFSVFYDPDAPSGQVVASSSPINIPNSSFSHPDTTYMSGGAISPAELLIFFVQPDTSTSRSDDYALYRQVNSGAPELVARRLLEPTSAPFFRYMVETQNGIDSIPDADLPLSHPVKLHGSAADSGAVIDSIRGVRVTLRATNGRDGEEERFEELSWLIRMPNVEQEFVQSCGTKPILGTSLSAVMDVQVDNSVNPPTADTSIILNWSEATDESAGEEDVVRYVIWRDDSGGSSWNDPYLSIPAGEATYTYTDAAVEPGNTYRYGLAAQDCTPTLSDITTSTAVAIP